MAEEGMFAERGLRLEKQTKRAARLYGKKRRRRAQTLQHAKKDGFCGERGDFLKF